MRPNSTSPCYRDQVATPEVHQPTGDAPDAQTFEHPEPPKKGLRQSGSLTLASMAQCLLLLLPRRGFLPHSVCGKNTCDGNRGNSWQKWTGSSESIVGSQLRAIYSDPPNPLNVDALIHKCEIIQSFVPSLVCISFPIKGCVTNKIRAILKIRLQN